MEKIYKLMPSYDNMLVAFKHLIYSEVLAILFMSIPLVLEIRPFS